MAKRSKAALRLKQSRKALSTQTASSDLLHPINSFAGLPYDIKSYVLRQFQFSPADLLSLAQLNRPWRECATDESLWAPWFEVLDALI